MNIIQIGCHSGNDKASSFLSLNEKYLNKVLLIDASPSALSLAKIFYKDFKKVELFNFAVVDTNDTEIEIFYPVDENNVSYSYCSVLESHVKTHKDFEGENTPQQIKTHKVPATRVNKLLKHFAGEYIDRLYLDVEGLDCSIINDIDLHQYNIGHIRFEYTHSEGAFKTNGPILKKTINRLSSFGYSIIKDPNFPEDLIALKNI